MYRSVALASSCSKIRHFQFHIAFQHLTPHPLHIPKGVVPTVVLQYCICQLEHERRVQLVFRDSVPVKLQKLPEAKDEGLQGGIF